MNHPASPQSKPRTPTPLPFHYAWIIVAVTFFASLNGAGIRAVPQVLILPLEDAFGWSRSIITGGLSINIFLYGAAAPVVGWIVDHYGPRRVMLYALGLISLGLLGSTFVNHWWQFWLTWGVVVGVGAGGMSGVLSASVAHRWFNTRRGLAVAILSSGSSTGQIIAIPLMLTVLGYTTWRNGSYVLVAAAGIAAALVLMLMRDRPEDVGLEAYNEGPATAATPADSGRAAATSTAPAAPAMGIRDAVKTPTFWLLCGVFSICGGTANGLIGTSLVPHTQENGFDSNVIKTTVLLLGTMNILGTIFSGWITDRVDPRKVIAIVFALRGGALFFLTLVDDTLGLLVFAIIYGLDWFATVPPVVTLAGQTFGKQSIGRIYGWIFLSHQVGASLMAQAGGFLYDYSGNYQLAYFAGGWMGLLATAFALSIRPGKPAAPAGPEPAGAAA